MKRFGSKLALSEVKATDFDESAILRLLSEIAEEDVTIVATVVDQYAIRYPPKEMESIYRQAAAWTVRRLKELQAADAVAWAIFQKYERGDSRFYDVIESKIADETVIKHRDWR